MVRWQSLAEEMCKKIGLGVRSSEVVADWLTELVALRKIHYAGSLPEPEVTETDGHIDAKNVMDSL